MVRAGFFPASKQPREEDSSHPADCERSRAHQKRVTLEKLKLCSRKAGTKALPLSDVTASAGIV